MIINDDDQVKVKLVRDKNSFTPLTCYGNLINLILGNNGTQRRIILPHKTKRLNLVG